MAANRPRRSVKEINRWGYAELSPAVKPHPKKEVIESSDTEEEEEATSGSVSFSVNLLNFSFSVGRELDTMKIAESLNNTEYKNESTVWVKMKRPEEISAWIHKSGKVTARGCIREENAMTVGRQLARLIQTKCDYPDVKFLKFKINNVNVSATLPFGIKLTEFAQAFTGVEFEPELFPAAIFRMKKPKATMHIFHNGRVNVVGVKSASEGEEAVNCLYPMVHGFQTKPAKRKKSTKPKQKSSKKR